jgi:acetyl esterase
MPSDPGQLVDVPSNYKPDEIRTYKSAGEVELKAHVFFPKDFDRTVRRPAFVFFHPGGWSMGEPAWGYLVCHRYASFGMVAISFQYRLSAMGGYTPAEAVSDARSAIRWTRQRALELGIDSGRLVAGGISAGGHLAACSAILTGPDDPRDDLMLSPVPDALALLSSPVNPAIDSHFIELMQGIDKPENYSPAHHVRKGLPPMCLIQGTADEIVSYDSVKDFATKMREAGNRCDLHTLEGADHFLMKQSDQVRAAELIVDFLSELGYVQRKATL